VRALLWAVLGTLRSLFRTQRELALENLALRQQVAVLIRTRGTRRVSLGLWDRAFWVILSQKWAGWRGALAIVQPTTVIRWHREGFSASGGGEADPDWAARGWTARSCA
jgi:hypothetical protein